MIVLSETTDSIRTVLSGAIVSDTVKYVASWRDITSSAYTAGRSVTVSNNTTAVTSVSAPASSTQRVLDYFSAYNSDTATATIEIVLRDSGTDYTIWKGTLASEQMLTYCDGAGWSVSPSTVGYALKVQALTSSPTDAQTVYFGMLPKAPVTAANTSKVYIPKSGRIKRAEIYCYSGTAGTSESWSLYVRHNNTTDYLIATLAVSASERVFSNAALDVVVSAGDYFEIKSVQPTWATNPLTTIYGGYIYIE